MKKKLLTVSSDRSLQIMLINEKDLLATWESAHEGIINDIIMTKNGKFAFTVSEDLSIKQWDIDNQRIHHGQQNAHSENILCCALTNDDKFLFTGSKDCTIKQWSVEQFKEVASFTQPTGTNGWIKCIAISPNNKHLLAGTRYCYFYNQIAQNVFYNLI